MIFTRLLFFSILFAALTGCTKEDPEEVNCQEIQKVEITGAKSSYYVGDEISLSTNMLPPIALFIWNVGPNPNSISGLQTVHISSCSKGDEGWYYLTVSYPGCAVRQDSVYISVKNRPATATCNLPNNSVSFSSIPNITVGSENR